MTLYNLLQYWSLWSMVLPPVLTYKSLERLRREALASSLLPSSWLGRWQEVGFLLYQMLWWEQVREKYTMLGANFTNLRLVWFGADSSLHTKCRVQWYKTRPVLDHAGGEV